MEQQTTMDAFFSLKFNWWIDESQSNEPVKTKWTGLLVPKTNCGAHQISSDLLFLTACQTLGNMSTDMHKDFVVILFFFDTFAIVNSNNWNKFWACSRLLSCHTLVLNMSSWAYLLFMAVSGLQLDRYPLPLREAARCGSCFLGQRGVHSRRITTFPH